MPQTKKGQKTPPDFDSIKKMTTDNQEYWEARELMPLLGYGNKWQNFQRVIKDAIISYQSSGGIIDKHFIAFEKTVPMPRGGERKILDYVLSRWACYLIAMNGSSSKPEIAAAQNYFVVATHKHEMHELLEQQKERIFLRDQVAESNKDLVETAVQAGLEEKNIPIFHIAGYNALYAMPYEELMQGEALLFHSLLLVGYLLLLMVVVHLFVVFFEEPQLTRRFGESYQSYVRTVPRWLPRL